jgi:hypothetical protein
MDNEELLDGRCSKAGITNDSELIKECTGGIEKRIRSAKSRKEAKLIVSDAYRCLIRCESEVIPLFLVRYVTKLFEKYWEGRK